MSSFYDLLMADGDGKIKIENMHCSSCDIQSIMGSLLFCYLLSLLFEVNVTAEHCGMYSVFESFEDNAA